MWNVCLRGAHLWDKNGLPQVKSFQPTPDSYFPCRLPHNKTELLAMVKKQQARQFHQALYSINQKSSDLKKWEALQQAPKLGTAYKWDYWAISKKNTCIYSVTFFLPNQNPCNSVHKHCKTQGGEVYLQIRASLRSTSWDTSVRWAVHRLWHDQKYSGIAAEYENIKWCTFCNTWQSCSPLTVRCMRCT